MFRITASEDWSSIHPDAVIGLLELSGVDNAQSSPALDERKREIEARLRERYRRFTRQDFLALPVMVNYREYYKRFDKTYHLLLQVESIVLKDKNLPDVSPLVGANFAAEVETFVLTAGHDVARLHEPVWIDVSRPGDQITQMNGAVTAMRVGDMIMRDAEGISCSIIYGQDNRSPISALTSHVLFVTYVPAGVTPEIVIAHLMRIEEHVRLFSPKAVLEQRQLLQA